MTINDTDSECGGLNTFMRGWLKDDGCSCFVGVLGWHVKEGINGVLSVGVGCISVDGAVRYVLMILLYVESTWEHVSCWLVGG